MKQKNSITWFLMVLLLMGGISFMWKKSHTYNTTSAPEEKITVEQSVNTSAAVEKNPETAPEESIQPEPEIKKAIANEVDLDIPFTTQAPYANWDLPYQEACEETAALMAHYYFQEKSLSPAVADTEILSIVDFQEKQYGFYKDTTAAETVRFMRDMWGYKDIEIQEATKENIKQALADGSVVLAPAAGRQLHNPYYSGDGPLYHMLVIRGYTSNGTFITNDAGTKRGEKYEYDADVLVNAIHDWNGGDVENGAKLIIIINGK